MITETMLLHPAVYLAVKALTLLLVASVYWFVATHYSGRHQPEQ